jgi:proteic killer suppression protein
MIKAYEVLIPKKVDQDVEYLPIQVLKKFRSWIKFVKLYGIREVRLVKGYHDEPLKGERAGQRSIRLNRAYRVIYIELQNDEIEIIKVIEVHKHDY